MSAVVASGVVRYRVRHETVYSYGGDVAHSHQLLHLTPRDAPLQTCHSRAITLTPQPSTRREDVDAFGNHVTRLEYDLPHDRLEVLAEVGVDVQSAPPVTATDSHAWEAVRSKLIFSGRPMSEDLLEACRYRMESSYVRIKQTFTDYGDDCFLPKRPVLDASEALMRKIHREFKYAPGSTNIRTSAIEAFKARQGVCQDFSHIMIACLRSRGLAARYVSGYLRTLPPPGADAAYVGADASHAWVSVFCPPFGWIDLDPTNDVRVNSDHIIIAWGRDFGDVSPLRGVIVGGGRHRLSVRVSVQAE
ncbi:MAG TPA: transglutaminase family protein [Steroidobacteraceae bacterium]|nr:transglutaminase family protein [Steroidobacteraceae bacterium]